MSICPPGAPCNICFPKPSVSAAQKSANTVFTKSKEPTMSVATVTATTVERTRTVAVKEKEFTLVLGQVQAGYLYDLLARHVTGEVATAIFSPLARKLRDAGVDSYTYAAKNASKVQTAKEAQENAAWGFYGYEASVPTLNFKSAGAKDEARSAGIAVY